MKMRFALVSLLLGILACESGLKPPQAATETPESVSTVMIAPAPPSPPQSVSTAFAPPEVAPPPSDSPAPPTPIPNAEAVIRGQLAGAARACYNRALAGDPTLVGRVVITLRVLPDGQVESVSVAERQGLTPEVASCIASAARRAVFASTPTGGTLNAPFNFVKKKP